jgi:hypothetical protein
MEHYRKTVLTRRNREVFDPNNTQHLVDYSKFIRYNKWKDGCNYLLEEPFYDIPSMINSKLLAYFLKPYMEN